MYGSLCALKFHFFAWKCAFMPPSLRFYPIDAQSIELDIEKKTGSA